MKRNQTPNISSSSLRSSSRKNLKRNSAINSGLSSKSPINSSTHSQTSNKSRRLCTTFSSSKKTIGSSSNQEITCKGCKNSFKLYQDTKQFMMLHVKSNDECKKHYPQCVPPCNKLFFDTANLHSHQSRCSKKSNCYKEFMRFKIMSKFSSSQVNIPKISTPAYPTTSNIPTKLNSFNEYNKSLMFAKQHHDYMTFLPTKNFINKNIHHAKPLSNIATFQGHATIDHSMLKAKKDVVLNKIYQSSSTINDNDFLIDNNDVNIGSSYDHEKLSKSPRLSLSHSNNQQIVDMSYLLSSKNKDDDNNRKRSSRLVSIYLVFTSFGVISIRTTY